MRISCTEVIVIVFFGGGGVTCRCLKIACFAPCGPKNVHFLLCGKFPGKGGEEQKFCGRDTQEEERRYQ